MNATTTPPPDPPADTASLGRKRQRSSSMQSATSSSPKRSASEDPAQDNVPLAVRTPAVEDDIDAYMAEQGDLAPMPAFSVPSASSSFNDAYPPPHASSTATNSPPPTPASTSTSTPEKPAELTDIVTPAERHAIIQTHRKEQMEVGQTWYLVSRAWYRRWERACTGEIDKQGPINHDDIGPVDNSDLLDFRGSLKDVVVEGVDVEFVSEDAWKQLISWYGEPEHPLPRPVISRGVNAEASLELYPFRLKVFRLVKLQPQQTVPEIHGPEFPDVVISCQATASKLGRELFKAAREPGRLSDYRVWKLNESVGDAEGGLYPVQRLIVQGGEPLDPNTNTLEEELINPGDAFVLEMKDIERHWLVEETKVLPAGASASRGLSLPPVFGSGPVDFFSRFTGGRTSSPTAGPSTLAPSSSKLSNSTSVTTITKAKNEQKAGTMGLGNMGNTCFMNSALQCLAHQEELVDYFLTGVYKQELNRDNPLGMSGAIAEAFGALLSRLWAASPPSTSYTPREFKMQLQRFAPQFSGYQQHDSQELVAFLLDGLHEDLNRIVKKPYVEKPDWEGGGERAMIELANTSWDGYMKRNDSVIVDLFQGQYKSTLVCPECQKVSITFDPFMYLTLPLPVQKKWKHSVLFVPWDVEKPHLNVLVELNRDSSLKDLKRSLGRWLEVEPDNLLTLEVFSGRFYKNLDDNVMCGDIQTNDHVVCFELPCNAQQSRSYKPDPRDPFILPVFFTDLPVTPVTAPLPRYTSYSRNNASTPWGYPLIVVIEQERAVDEALIYEDIVDRMRRWTIHDRDLFDWEGKLASTSTSTSASASGSLSSSFVDLKKTDVLENGDFVMEEPEEGDITDQKDLLLEDLDQMHEPRQLGVKRDVFNLRLQSGNKQWGTNAGFSHVGVRFDTWERRREQAEQLEEEEGEEGAGVATGSRRPAPLIRADDGLFCEFDPNMKAYYFGEERKQWENSRWTTWKDFIHPEVAEAQKAASAKQTKGITLADCLEEFTREEQLGEEDLWYCPRCKKHQQATKKFDIWKMPDVLVVHLKRFSNNRMLRDKIDTFVDFPVEGLDLEYLAEERHVAKRLADAGEDVSELIVGDLNEPLVYDLFAVDEHMGGLGGGHYRAYAKNHQTEKWYHFDDSYVSASKSSDAVNANAYLLFYRRRTEGHLGARTAEKVEEAKQNPVEIGTPPQLPTPPEESMPSTRSGTYGPRMPGGYMNTFNEMPMSQSNGLNSPSSTPPGMQDLPGSLYPLTTSGLMFHDREQDDYRSMSLMSIENSYDFPNPSSRAPSDSSREAVPDLDDDGDSIFQMRGNYSYDRAQGTSPPSPRSPTSDPFEDMNSQKADSESDAAVIHTTVKEIPLEESTLLDIE